VSRWPSLSSWHKLTFVPLITEQTNKLTKPVFVGDVFTVRDVYAPTFRASIFQAPVANVRVCALTDVERIQARVSEELTS
jgi:hypothetical protein